MRTLQIVISIVFGVFILVAVLSFAGFIPSPGSKQREALSGNLILWGTDESGAMSEFLKKGMEGEDGKITIEYVRKSPDMFANDLIEALAAGQGPDMIIMPQDLIVRLDSKIYPFAPEQYPERDFLDTFIEEGGLFITPHGMLALPVSVDPMVMYWNRDIFTNKGAVLPPKYWDEFLNLVPTLTDKNESNDILTSGLAFGEFQNVDNAKDILAMLFLQSGNPIMVRTTDGGLAPMLSGLPEKKIPPISEVIRFYTDFSNPTKTIYSWNSSLPGSKKSFLSGDLAIYFGFASEMNDIKTKNPNLNFDVALVPQIRDYPRRVTYGNISGIAILNVSQQKAAAIYTARILTTPTATAIFAQELNKVSPSRAVLAKAPADPYQKLFYESAVLSKGWLDPNREKTKEIFQTTIETINSDQSNLATAMSTMQQRFGLLVK